MQKEPQDSSTRDYYSKAQFWDQRYVQKGGFFDWYAEYPELKYAFQSQYGMTVDDNILMVGCGNSKLSQQMYQAGYKHIYNIDISPVVIQQMKQASPDMEWLVMDATAMTFEDKKFDYVIDKGTMDALIAGRDLTPTEKLLNQCMRVCKQQGQLILITYGSPQGRKKIFQNSLPFNLFDYYFAFVNLNDMSTLINLMRNNTIGPNGQAVEKAEALQKSMKQFMMVKIMRQRRSKDKQFVIWENYMKKVQPTSSVKSQLQILKQKPAQTQQNKGLQPKQQEKQQKKESQISQKQQNQGPKQQNIKITYLSKPQKQSYVYAYSIKRKFGHDFNPQQIVLAQVKKNFEGSQNTSHFQIRGSARINQSISKCIQFCNKKQIAHSSVNFIDSKEMFSNIVEKIKINIETNNNQNESSVGLNVLTKTNIDLEIGFENLQQVLQALQKLKKHLVESMGLVLHPCPKSYSLFTMIKGRMKAKSSNQLLNKYWYPTFSISQVDIKNSTVKATLSIPPILPEYLQKIQQNINCYFKKYKKLQVRINQVRNGFLSFPQLNLFGVLNMASLTHNHGKSLNVYMQDFWQGNHNYVKEQQSKLFIVNNSHIKISQNLIPFVILHILALY